MKLPEPAYTKIRCPHCEALASISFRDGWRFWLAESNWKCPNCGSISTTVELNEASEKVLVSPELIHSTI